MAPKKTSHMGSDTLVKINMGVVALTGEPHEISQADSKKLVELVNEVELRAENEELQEAIPEKAALLVFRIASGQHFRAGNRRTALLAGLVFLAKNGYAIEITDPEFISVVDRAGIAAASLDDVHGVMLRLAKKSKTERKGWDKAVVAALESQRDFLTKVG